MAWPNFSNDFRATGEVWERAVCRGGVSLRCAQREYVISSRNDAFSSLLLIASPLSELLRWLNLHGKGHFRPKGSTTQIENHLTRYISLNMIVRLYEHAGTALVVPHPTGVVYSNQAGGHACLQPNIEGFLVPIANEVGLAPSHSFRSPENDLFKYFATLHSCGAPISETDALEIEAIMHQLPLWGGLRVDRDRLKDSAEAWVFVTIEESEHRPILVDGIDYPIHAILTWTNSD